MLEGPPALPGSRRALCTYELADQAPILDLDDASALVNWGLKPSEVVTRDRARTQAWALRVYEAESHAGVRWWSYWNPDWGSLGLWDLTAIEVVKVDPLTVDQEDLEAARQVLLRSWVR